MVNDIPYNDKVLLRKNHHRSLEYFSLKIESDLGTNDKFCCSLTASIIRDFITSSNTILLLLYSSSVNAIFTGK